MWSPSFYNCTISTVTTNITLEFLCEAATQLYPLGLSLHGSQWQLQGLKLPENCYRDRHSLIALVIQFKLILLILLIHSGKTFRDIRSNVYTVEGQKRGLPLIHLYICLLNIINATEINSLISEELPNPISLTS